MAKYFEVEGDYVTACDYVLKEGGQLFANSGKHGPFTVVRGSNVYTFWPKNSLTKGQLIEACSNFDVDPYGMTGGRLCRYLIKEVLQLPYKGTFYSDKHKNMAKNGGHWHYQKIVPGQYRSTLEFDIKSAYFTSLFRLPTLLLNNSGRFVSDNGAMDNLKALQPLFPKWLRLQFLGILTSHERRYFARKEGVSGWELKPVIQHEISYGAAFNCAHQAIFNLYKLMKEIDRLGGDFIVRMHTDSFTVKSEIPMEMWDEICELISSFGADLWLKKQGPATFFDLNSGFVGRQCIGAKIDCLEQLKDSGLEHNFKASWADQPEFWKLLIKNYDDEINALKPVPVPMPIQLDIEF